MAYRTEPIPYENPNRDMAPSALKMAFASTMASLPQRVDRISHYLHESAGAMITAQSSDDEIDQLPKFIAQLGGLWNPRKLLIGNGESGASEKLAFLTAELTHRGCLGRRQRQVDGPLHGSLAPHLLVATHASSPSGILPVGPCWLEEGRRRSESCCQSSQR